MTFPVADAIEKATGKTGQELTSLLAQHLMHVGRRGNGTHALPALIGANRQKQARPCPQCQQSADLVLLIEKTLSGEGQ